MTAPGSLRGAALSDGRTVMKAAVDVDGELRGYTPVHVGGLEAGPHQVRVVGERRSSSTRVLIRSGETARVLVELPPP